MGAKPKAAPIPVDIAAAAGKPRATGEPIKGWTKLDNLAVTELIAGDKIGPLDLKVIILIGFNTFGAPGKPARWRVSRAEWAKLLHCTPQTAGLTLSRMERDGLIDAEPPGGNERRTKSWRLTPWNWAAAPKYVAPKPELRVMAEPEEDDEAERPAARRIAVGPGRSKRVRVQVTQRDGQGATSVELLCHNKRSSEESFGIAAGKPGQVVIDLLAAGTPATPEKPKSAAPAESAASKKNHRSKVSNSNKTQDRSELLSFVVSYRNYFEPIFVDELKMPLTDETLDAIISAAQGAPVSDFDRHIDRLRKRKMLSRGLIVYAAQQDVGPAFAARKRREAAAEAKSTREAENLQADADARRRFPDGDESAWPRIRALLKKRVSAEAFDNWFACTRGEGVSKEGTLLVAVPDAHAAALIADEYQAKINAAAAEIDPAIECVQFFVPRKARGHHA